VPESTTHLDTARLEVGVGERNGRKLGGADRGLLLVVFNVLGGFSRLG